MENEELDELIKKYIYESPDGGSTVSRREIGDETNSKEYLNSDDEGTFWESDTGYSITGVSSPNTIDIGSASSSTITIDTTYGSYTSGPNSDITLTVDGEERKISDLFKTVDTIKKRMAILEPKKEMLEKYKVLQSLYEQYKTAEALLDGPDPEDEE